MPREVPSRRERALAWTPTLKLAPVRGPALWALMALGVSGAALVSGRWAVGLGDPFTNGVMLTMIAWVTVAGVIAGEARRAVLAATPYAGAALSLATLATLQAARDPSDVGQTNALVGAFLALPVVYLLFFLLRRPGEALRGAIATLVVAVVLQLVLSPAVSGREAEGPWVGLLTAGWHGVLVLLFYYVPRLRSSRDLLEAVIGSSRDPVVLAQVSVEDQAGGSQHGALAARVTFANEAARNAFGAAAGEDLLAEGPLGAATNLRDVLLEVHEGAGEVRLNASLPTTDGPRWFRVTAASFWGGVAVNFADITEHKEDESRALELAHTDPLTGLTNRRGFEVEAERRLASTRSSGQAATLCYLDLDGFKAVNDSHGHEVGDGLLRHVAGRLRTAVRATDLVGRLGGDEFVVLAEGLDPGGSRAFFDRVRAAVDAPYSVSGLRLDISSSLGVVPRVADLTVALARADAAMYRAKLRGGGVELEGEPG